MRALNRHHIVEKTTPTTAHSETVSQDMLQWLGKKVIRYHEEHCIVQIQVYSVIRMYLFQSFFLRNLNK